MMMVGFIDTGCGACLFSNEIGMDLGIDIESGELAIFKSGAGGSVPAYGHSVVFEFLGSAFESFAYFAKYQGLRRNLLGRVWFLRKLRFGLIEYDAMALFATLAESRATSSHLRMANPEKQLSQSYTALTQQVAREAEEPITVAEITRRVHHHERLAYGEKFTDEFTYWLAGLAL